MTTTMPSRADIDRAEPLDFPDRRPVRQELTITIHARIGGFDTEICFSGHLDQLETLTRKLVQLGASPAGVHQVSPAAGPAARKAAERVEPIYQPDGTPCCPVHKRPLTEGQYGLYCKSKAQPGDVQNDKGYCSLKFAE